MMELRHVKKEDLKGFISFYEKRYLNHPLRRNSMSGLLKDLLYGKSVMCKSASLEPLMVMEDGNLVMICVLAYVDRMPNYVQIAFFEADVCSQEGFRLIMERAEEFAREKGATKITGSLNVHVNYGLGFLASGYDAMQGFGTMHNPPFYHEFFETNGFNVIEMVSFRKDFKDFNDFLDPKLVARVTRRYTTRNLDMARLKEEADLYTRINNEAFHDHLFYYKRKAEEDLELFSDFRHLLNPENLVFVYKGEKAVGFMLWYPDFHEIMKVGESIGVKTVLRHRFSKKKISTFKVVEMGVIPSEQKHGAILALLDHVFKCTKGKYQTFESGWILDANHSSKMLGVKFADGEYKKYKAYIKDV
jgi:GNAT superfamily N-acetyltransferase